MNMQFKKRHLHSGIALMCAMLLLIITGCDDNSSITGPEKAVETVSVAPEGAGAELSTTNIVQPDEVLDHTSERNQASYWEGRDPTADGEFCVKIDEGSDENFTVPAPEDGHFFTKIIVKQAQPHYVFHNPEEGDVLDTGGAYSHVILCQAPLPVFEPDPELTVIKDADASFDRRHLWDIDKRVETDEGHTVNGTPKIWLDIDGTGDESAEWTIDVSYEGSEDINGAVAGTIGISLGGNMDAYIGSVDDVITQNATETTATVDCVLDDGLDTEVTFPFLMTQGTDDILCDYEADIEVLDGINTATVTGQFRLPEGVEHEDFDEDGIPLDDSYDIDETATADVEFDEPETEINETVNVQDISDLTALGIDGVQNFGPLHAPDGDSFTYDHLFEYANYGQEQCGAHEYGNRATIEETEQFADANLKVNVECEVFKGETATGAGLPWSDTQRSPNNWFEYTELSAILAGVDIITGRNKTVIGTITGTNNEYTNLSFDLDGEWELADVSGAVKVHPMECTDDQRYVQPGQFDYHFDSFEDAEAFDFPKAECYGIHLDVGQWVSDPDFGP